VALVEIETNQLRDNHYILSIFLNNPSSRNAMTWEMGIEFRKIVMEHYQDPNLRGVILSGRNGVFSAGGDLDLLKSFSKKTIQENEIGMKEFYGMFLSIRKFSCPVIGAINGHAIGAGFSLALATDIRFVSHSGKYSFNFVKLGIHPGMGSSYIAPKLVGNSLAQDLLIGARMLSGKEMEELHLCRKSCPTDEIESNAWELAKELAESGPTATKLLKETLYDEEELDLALKREASAQAINFTSEEFQETIRSIEEKRPPRFS
jgi:enoyl-CoA hydratase/carnithine racemase